MPVPIPIDAVIIGGGATGLWLLDSLHRAGHGVVLLESKSLGSGQTVASQGIIHGGMKYSLRGALSRSAAAIRRMPLVWRECLAGNGAPDLRRTRMRAEHCHMWGSQSLGSRLGIWGAKALLKAKPIAVRGDQRPPVLHAVKGRVYRVDEPVICPDSFIACLAEQHQERILKIASSTALSFELSGGGHVDRLILTRSDKGAGSEPVPLRPGRVILAAGRSNAALRRSVGLATAAMQVRPLHMVVVRGAPDRVPMLNGHCVHANRTRVTVTTDTDPQGRHVWQVGGQVAEDGVRMDPRELIAHARSELADCLPEIDLSGLEWSTYRVDRSEGRSPALRRPSTPTVLEEGNVITAWPTKLALAPILAARITKMMEDYHRHLPFDDSIFRDWPRPDAAKPPWHEQTEWFQDP